MHLTGLRLTEVRSALTVLKERRLPSLDADLMVARCYSDLSPSFKQYDAVVKKLQSDLDATTDEAERKALLAQFEGLQERTFEVPPVRQKFTVAQMPKPFSGERGEANTTANAAVIIALGTEYFAFDEAPQTPTE